MENGSSVWRTEAATGSWKKPPFGLQGRMCGSAMWIWEKIGESPEIPTQRLRWRREIMWLCWIMMICCRRMRCMKLWNVWISVRMRMWFILTRIRWTSGAENITSLISSRILILICCGRWIISATCLW